MADSTGPYLIQAMELSKDWWEANEYCKHTPFFGWLKCLLGSPAYMDIWVDNKEMPKCVFLVKKGDGEPDYVIIKEMHDAGDKIQLVKPFLRNSNIIRINKDIVFDYIERDLWDLTVEPALQECHPGFASRCQVKELGACLSPETNRLVTPRADDGFQIEKAFSKTDLRTLVARKIHLKVLGDQKPGWRFEVGHTVFGRVLPVSHNDWQTFPTQVALAILGSTMLDEGREMFVITDESNLQPLLDLRLRESRRLKRIEFRQVA